MSPEFIQLDNLATAHAGACPNSAIGSVTCGFSSSFVGELQIA